MDVLLGILKFVLSFGIAVVVHEFGHFIMAKLFRVKVHEFAFGWPPLPIRLKIFSWSGTNFVINPIPLGGYVRINEEDLDSKSKVKRILAYLAGPTANMLFAGSLIGIYGLMTNPELSAWEAMGRGFVALPKLVIVLVSLVSSGGADLVGPIGVAAQSMKLVDLAIYQGDISILIVWLVAINLNLGFFNILPIPMLDGGRILFVLIEGITGRRNRRLESALTGASLLLLLILVVVVSCSDLANLLAK